jgi:hypothetical protein
MTVTDRAWHLGRLAAALALAGLASGGCASFGAKPWQHDLLSRESMKPVTHPLPDAVHDHVYFSKEGATGGRTTSGGGCGCN